VRLETDDAGQTFYVAYIEELPGLESIGDSQMDARAGLVSAFEDYLAAMLEWGEPVPEPKQWPESFGWNPNAPGAVAGTIRVAALAVVDVMASPDTAVPAFDGVIESHRFGEQAELETVAA
jgi:predicted RNase H-like HicB family nuclease